MTMAGNVDPNDETDSFPVPRLAAPDQAPEVTLTTPDATRTGVVLSVTDDEIAVLVAEGLPVDSQVDLQSQGVQSVGVVIWSRANEAEGDIALGIEIVGGAKDWETLLA